MEKIAFLSTLSLRRATSQRQHHPNHQEFLSTLSLRRATWKIYNFNKDCLDFYPRSPCGERPRIAWEANRAGKISIHALLAESDLFVVLFLRGSVIFLSTLSLRRATRLAWFGIIAILNFYPRSPCGERQDTKEKLTGLRGFLSTLSLRRATKNQNNKGHHQYYFYPRSPCGERRSAKVGAAGGSVISIHALLAESDSQEHSTAFESCISIHALLAESDDMRSFGGADCSISIHALLAESDG